ncbi:MAG: HD domain-containing protein [Opitutae bacterium]|nr:HD domain-containing protein [Opitutae bacterium]
MAPPLDFAGLERRCREKIAVVGGDAAHDLAHVERVVGNARSLAAAEGARLEVVLPAAWLHDCVTVPKDSPQRAAAARLAAAQAGAWLGEWGWPEALRPEIAHAIEAHSFSAGIAPRTIEARVVQDADRLDALGAAGLARCLMLGGAMGRALYAADDPWCERRAPDDRASCVDHFYTKLLKLEGTMQTAAGRAEAQRRTAFLRSFLAQLQHESSRPA